MIKRVIDHVIFAIGISFIITNATMFIFVKGATGEQVKLCYLLWLLAGVIYGIIALIYDTKLNKKAAAAIHFALNLGLSLFAIDIMFKKILFFQMDFSIWWLIAIFILIYSIIAICIYTYEKISVKELNKKLQSK